MLDSVAQALALMNYKKYFMSPNVFGRYYVGSNKQRHRMIKRKRLAKQNKR